ncbi:MAG: hypothetical protein Q4B60_05215 [Erysipelotrichaceae bacterium]|nr:hypothetical protein [Erysipelotrichaceae bacterium]
MKINFKDLYNISDYKDYEVDEELIVIENNPFINRIKDVKGLISFFYNYDDELMISYQLDGVMVCPDSITLEDTDLEFNIEDELKVVRKENEDGFYFIDGMDIKDFVSYIVLPEVPIKVEKRKENVYYSGDGWTVLSEEEYNRSSKKEIDPRLAKLLEYKEE